MSYICRMNIVRKHLYKNPNTGSKVILNVLLCLGCEKEIFVAPNKKNVTGYCKTCYYLYNRKRKDLIENKVCSRCKELIPISEFNKIKLSGGTSSVCIRCNILYKYNISRLDYNNILKNQGYRCKICNRTSSSNLHVDHCHKTGKIRGLLCGNCNRGIGMFKENLEILENAINYLKNNS